MSVLVYRIENEHGHGAYRIPVEWRSFSQPYSDTRHPGPSDDPLLRPYWTLMSGRMKDHYFFGFESIEQLKNWFFDREWLEDLHNSGAKLSIYQSNEDDVIYGRTQLIFLRARALHICRRELISL
jgi:hypothetical protein